MSWNDDGMSEEEVWAAINRSIERLRRAIEGHMTLEQIDGFMIQTLFMSCGYSPLMVEEEE